MAFLRNVLGASRHLAWYVSWQTGGPGAIRQRPRPPVADAVPPRQVAV